MKYECPITTQVVESTRIPLTHPRLSEGEAVDSSFRQFVTREKQCSERIKNESLFGSMGEFMTMRRYSYPEANTTSDPITHRMTLYKMVPFYQRIVSNEIQEWIE